MHQMHQAPDRIRLAGTANAIHMALMDAQSRLQNIGHQQVADYDLFATMWAQVWPSSNCGFNSNLDTNHTASYVIIVTAPRVTKAVVVWIAGRYAYTVYEPTPRFLHDVEHHCLLGENAQHRPAHYDKRPHLTMPPTPEEPPFALAR